MGLFGMSSKGYLQHAAGLEKGKDVWGTVLDLGLYTMFLDVRIVVIDVGQIRGDSSDEELLQSCSETGFPGECEKHRVVCAVCLGDHFDIGVVYGPKARAVFDVGDDWTRACVLILKHLRARILSPKPKAFWALGPEQIRNSSPPRSSTLFGPLLPRPPPQTAQLPFRVLLPSRHLLVFHQKLQLTPRLLIHPVLQHCLPWLSPHQLLQLGPRLLLLQLLL